MCEAVGEPGAEPAVGRPPPLGQRSWQGGVVAAQVVVTGIPFLAR